MPPLQHRLQRHNWNNAVRGTASIPAPGMGTLRSVLEVCDGFRHFRVFDLDLTFDLSRSKMCVCGDLTEDRRGTFWSLFEVNRTILKDSRTISRRATDRTTNGKTYKYILVGQ